MADVLTKPESKSHLQNICLNSENDDYDTVMDLKGDIRNAFTDARVKINHLRLELKEKDESLANEKFLRDKAEKELTSISLTGITNGRHSEEASPSGSPTSFLSGPVNGYVSSSGYSSINRREEIKMVKQLNKKLLEQIANLEQELAVVLSKQENDAAGIEAKVSARGAALIDRIYTAQKDRDLAVMNRLKTANEERDDCLRKIQELEEELCLAQKNQIKVRDAEDIYVNYDEFSISDILQHIQKLNSRKSLEEPTRVIEERMKQSIKAMKSQSMNEVKQLMRERDEAIAKVRILERELEMMTAEKLQSFEQQHEEDAARLKASQTQLLICQQEKEESDKRVTILQEELKTLRVHYSLQKSLKADQTLRNQFNSTINNFESKLKQRDSEIQIAQRSYDDVVAKLNHTIREKNVIAKQLQETILQLKTQKEKSTKLEKLVNVLRMRIKQDKT